MTSKRNTFGRKQRLKRVNHGDRKYLGSSIRWFKWSYSGAHSYWKSRLEAQQTMSWAAKVCSTR